MTMPLDPHLDALRQAEAVQREAADPRHSRALRAAAGSGKTKVLVDRFIRLCLAGSPPKAILAVTFTNRAATEIKDRLLQRTRRFALLPRDELAVELRDLLGGPVRDIDLVRAASLYEEILEDLSGLHVGTIHSFCQLLLNRFAADVGLDPTFSILDHEDELWEEALDRLEQEVAVDPERRAELASLATTPRGVRGRLTRLCRNRLHLERWLDRLDEGGEASGQGDDSPTRLVRGDHQRRLGALLSDLVATVFTNTMLESDPEPGPSALAAQLVAAGEAFLGAGLDRIAAVEAETTAGFRDQVEGLRQGIQNVLASLPGRDLAAAEVHRAAHQRARLSERVTAALSEIRGLFLTQQGRLRSLRGRRGTQPERQAAFATAASPLLEILALADLLDLFEFNRRLLTYGLWALDIYDDLKRRQRCVDFQDLERLVWLLMRGDQALTVQYRFDHVLDHLLIDEFQDTNRNQWEILRPFAEEFLSGESARPAGRTLFLVGDVKQSIYGFRGAEPAIFGEAAAWLTQQTGREVLTLPSNFRSLPAIVRSVGGLFNCEPLAGILPPGEAEAALQAGVRTEAAGEVIFLPVFASEDEDLGADHLAAGAAVATVRHLLAHARIWKDGEERPVSLSDILILCRSRTHITIYEQAFRAAGIPIRPAGRGLLAKSREVRDVLALLRWLVYPNDDAALATVLRSPLFRVGERKLQQVLSLLAAPGATPSDAAAAAVADGAAADGRATVRDRSLWSVLRRHAEDLGLVTETELLVDWRRLVGFASCHDLLRAIYRTGHVLDRYAAALTEQARFNLLRLHDLALSPELGRWPTLRRFAEGIQRAADTAAEEEATPPEEGRGRLRLMSIHAAKGLEAPVVLLVDADAPARGDSEVLPLRPGASAGPLLYGLKQRHLDAFRRSVNAASARMGALPGAIAHARCETRREEADILYVAMTRARDRLYVMGARPPRKGDRESFLDWLLAAALADGEGRSAAAARLSSEISAGSDASPYSLQTPLWLERAEIGPGLRPEDESEPPQAAYVTWQAPTLGPLVRVVNPSAHDEAPPLLGHPSERATDDDVVRATALARGEEIHLWLQRAAEQGRMPPGGGEAWREARAVFENPGLSWLFHPTGPDARGLSEVPFIHRQESAATAPGSETPETRVVGQIDRLVLRPGRADLVDYKSDRFASDPSDLAAKVAEHRPQLVAYRAAVAALYPDRDVHAHLLFTHQSRDGYQGLLVEV
jgi:ATP-dependent helicase/nuclease subunit A